MMNLEQGIKDGMLQKGIDFLKGRGFKYANSSNILVDPSYRQIYIKFVETYLGKDAAADVVLYKYIDELKAIQ